MAKKSATVDDFHDYPDWFDTASHAAGPGGIFERATGVLLGEDGEPASAAVRAARAAGAEAEAAPAPKPRRDTRQILEAVALITAGADATTFAAAEQE